MITRAFELVKVVRIMLKPSFKYMIYECCFIQNVSKLCFVTKVAKIHKQMLSSLRVCGLGLFHQSYLAVRTDATCHKYKTFDRR